MGAYFALAAISPAFAADLPKAASATVCADQFLLGLGAPEQIVSVSIDAIKPEVSNYVDAARAYPQNSGRLEELIASGAEVVLIDAWASQATLQALQRVGIRPVKIPLAKNFDEIAKFTREIGAALGREAEANLILADFHRRLATVRSRVGIALDEAPLAAYYQPGGYSAGAGTFPNEVLEAAGLRNILVEQGRSGWRTLDLESLVAMPPDIYVLSFFGLSSPSLREQLTQHPILADQFTGHTVVEVPGREWVCSGWFVIDAVERLAEAAIARGSQ